MPFPAPLARRIAALEGWPRRAAAVAAGMASVLALAPFFAWPILFLTLPVLTWLLDGAVARASAAAPAPRAGSLRRRLAVNPAWAAATTAWLFGFGYFLAGLFWIGEAFLVEAEKFAVLMPLAVLLMPAGLALFWAAAAAVATRAWRPGLSRVLALALALSAAEWLRGHILTGFPWNVPGYALTAPLPLMQSAAVLGIYGLTLVVFLVFPAPLVLAADAARGDATARSRWLASGIAASMLLLLFGVGWARLATPPPTPDKPVRMRLVQPSVPQREKWRPENQERIFAEHLDLSLRDPAGKPDDARGIDLIVWPEAAMPFLPLRSPAALARIGDMLPPGAHLVSGALRLDEVDPTVPGSTRRVYNSLMAFGEGGRLVANYDKIHLVPFGEYLPLHEWLEAIGLENLSRLRGGFASGVRPRPLMAIPGLPKLGPLICYEAIFPGTLVQGTERPAALVNVTNDGWFGNTTGPRQHLHQARVRAVEEGLPVLRVANNGISALIDAQGRLLARLDLDAKGVIDATLPGSLPPPIYARVGDAAFLLLLMAGLGLLVLLRPRRRTEG